MRRELRNERLSVIIHTIAAVIVGIFSGSTTVTTSFLVSMVVLFVIAYVTDVMVGRKGIKWWIGNGAIVYIFVWLLVWIYIYNMR